MVTRSQRWLARRAVGRANVRRARVRAVAVLVVTAATAVVLAVVSHLAWLPMVLGILCTFPALYLAWLAVPGVVSPPEADAAGIPARGRPAAEWDLRRLGVHAAIGVPGVAEDVPPEYVPRDVDSGEYGVRAQVAAAARRGGFVLLVGGSSVGKTRSAAEAVTASLPDWWLVRPGGPGQVAALAAAPTRRLVVWLDELQHYLDGADGLTAAVVGALLDPPHPAVVIGTLWPALYTRYTAVPAPGGADPHARERQLLDLATVVRIGPAFSPAEQARAHAAAARDPRLKVALESPGYGLTQTLAAAPQLVARWHDAQATDPYAWAVLTAALDVARLGVRGLLSDGFLHAAAPGYLTSQQQAEAPKNWFEQALDYATGTLHGAAAALIPAAAGMGQVAGYTPADYLVQHATRERRSARVPAVAWEAAVDHVHDPADTVRLADSAANRLLYCYAIPLYQHATDTGDQHAARELAELLAQRGDLEGLRTRADAGDGNAAGLLAELLAEHGDLEGLRARADTGDPSAAWALAELLAEHGDLEGLRTRADAGDPYAAELLDRDPHQIDQMLSSRADAGYGNAAPLTWGGYVLPLHLALDGLRTRADAGDWYAAGTLAGLLAAHGDLDQAEWVLRAQAEEAAARQLAGLLAAHDDLDQTEQILRDRADVGDETAALQLAWLLAVPGDQNRLRALADAGDGNAAIRLAGRLAAHGDLDEAEQILRGLTDTGDGNAARALARLLTERGDLDGLRTLADAGDGYAAWALARLLTERGDLDGLRALTDAGDGNAASQLPGLLMKQGRYEEAEQLFQFGLNPDGSIAGA